MKITSSDYEVLLNLLGEYYPQFMSINSSRNVILDLSRGKVTVLVNLLEKEISGISSFTLRDKNLNDYYYFDWEFSNLLSEILNSSLNISELGSEQASRFFNRNVGFEVCLCFVAALALGIPPYPAIILKTLRAPLFSAFFFVFGRGLFFISFIVCS